MSAIGRFFRRSGLGGRPRDRYPWVRPAPAPVPEPTPAPPAEPGPRWRPFAWYGDDLTLRDDGARIRWTCSQAFESPAIRRENIALLHARGYSMTFVDQLHYLTKSLANRDGILEPHLLVEACAELKAAGLKAVPRFGYEDARELLAAIGGVSGYLPHLAHAAELLAPHVDGWCLGKESFERFTPDDVLAMVGVLRRFGLPIGIHLGQGERGPAGAEDRFWRDVRAVAAPCPVALLYQARHPRVEDGGRAFTTDQTTLRHELTAVVQWAGGRFAVVLAEHSYNGESLDAIVVTERHAQALGDEGLRVRGIAGTTNGCTRMGIAEHEARFGSPASPLPPDRFFPGAEWEHAADHDLHRHALDAVTTKVVAHATLIYEGREVWTIGDPGRRFQWSSTARPFMTTAYLAAIYDGLVPREALDRPIVESFPRSDVARLFEPWVTLAHLLSYTGWRQPIAWVYSGGGDARGKHWPRQVALFQDVTGTPVTQYLEGRVFRRIGSAITASLASDGSLRVHGSSRDLARAGYLWLHAGRWRDDVLFDADLFARAVAGGPGGDGHPKAVEGWQFHLVKNGRAWESPTDMLLPGVPDDTFMARDGGDDEGTSHGTVAVVPSLDLVFAGRGPRNASAFLPSLCRAVTG